MLKIAPKHKSRFKYHCSSPEFIMLVVYMKCRFSLSYREIEELLEIRGGKVDHATAARWVHKFTPLIDQKIRRRKRSVSGSWRMDETYIKVKGEWCYLYRAVDKYGATIDFILRKHRDAAAAKAFFHKAFKQHGNPHKIVMDKSGANKSALNEINKDLEKKDKIKISQQKHPNNIMEQDHRFVKKRTRPTLGFKNLTSAKRTIMGIENIRMIQKNQIKGTHEDNSVYKNFCILMAS